MEMPNTIPNALTVELLEDKYNIAAQSSLANYSFFMGTSNNNADEVLKMNAHKKNVCGVKIFMGASTGNMLVDSHTALDKIFSESEMLIATHCEDERIIKQNYERIKKDKGILSAADHPLIRNEEACYESSLTAIQFAKKYNSRLHHLHFTADDYEQLGYKIKCNPAIKAPHNKEALWKALLDDRLDVIATDHAPHLLSEKDGDYEHAHAGLPLVQHPLLMMLHHYRDGRISLTKIAEKMSHAVADCFAIEQRGYIREGYFADLVMVDMNKPHTVTKQNILYKCGWSPLENFTFNASIQKTMVSGNLVWDEGKFNEEEKGKRLLFDRK
jgi:dihydroorotase